MRLHQVNKLATILTGLTGILYTVAVVADRPSLDETAFLIDIPMITSATRMSQHQSDAPVSMTVIDRVTITASGAQTVADLLRLVPGFQVAHVNSNKYAATYHGHSDDFPRRLEVMIDGRSVYIPIISAVDWSSLGLHLDDIERIEIIRGSNTATYGSNAFMGAVNIITRHPATETKASASVTLGSLNTQNSHVRYSGANSAGHYRISASHDKNRGSSQFRDGARRSYLSFSNSFSPTINDQVDIWLGADQGYIKIGELQMERGLPENLFLPRRTYQSNYQHIQWQRFINQGTHIGIKAYRNFLRLEEQVPTIDELIRGGYSEFEAITLLNNNPEFRYLSEDGTTQQQDIEIYISHNTALISASSGLGIRDSFAKSGTLFEQGKISSTRYRLFNNTSISPSPLYTLNLGFQYESEDSGPEAISSRAAVNLHIRPGFTLRLGHSRSERLPSLHESYTSSTIYFDRENDIIFNAIRRPNPDLDTERILSNEIGLLYNFSQLPGHLDLRIFREEVSRGIESYTVPFPDPQLSLSNTTRTSRNVSSWVNQGAELQLKLQPQSNLWFLLNYAYINSTKDSFFDGRRIIARNELAPRHTASALINWQALPSLNLSATHYFMDRVHWFGTNTPNAYNRTDLRAATQWKTGVQSQGELSLTVQNAFGPAYQEFYDYKRFDRRFFMQFRLKYH